jgi:hypothetical protein
MNEFDPRPPRRQRSKSPGLRVAHGRDSHSVFTNDGSVMTEGKLDDEQPQIRAGVVTTIWSGGLSTPDSVSLCEVPFVE